MAAVPPPGPPPSQPLPPVNDDPHAAPPPAVAPPPLPPKKASPPPPAPQININLQIDRKKGTILIGKQRFRFSIQQNKPKRNIRFKRLSQTEREALLELLQGAFNKSPLEVWKDPNLEKVEIELHGAGLTTCRAHIEGQNVPVKASLPGTFMQRIYTQLTPCVTQYQHSPSPPFKRIKDKSIEDPNGLLAQSLYTFRHLLPEIDSGNEEAVKQQQKRLAVFAKLTRQDDTPLTQKDLEEAGLKGDPRAGFAIQLNSWNPTLDITQKGDKRLSACMSASTSFISALPENWKEEKGKREKPQEMIGDNQLVSVIQEQANEQYVSFQFEADHWWRCDKAAITLVTNQEVLEAIPQRASYLVYRKKKPLTIKQQEAVTALHSRSRVAPEKWLKTSLLVDYYRQHMEPLGCQTLLNGDIAFHWRSDQMQKMKQDVDNAPDGTYLMPLWVPKKKGGHFVLAVIEKAETDKKIFYFDSVAKPLEGLNALFSDYTLQNVISTKWQNDGWRCGHYCAHFASAYLEGKQKGVEAEEIVKTIDEQVSTVAKENQNKAAKRIAKWQHFGLQQCYSPFLTNGGFLSKP